MVVLHAAVAIAAVIALILIVKVEPVIALVVGSLYLGLASGLGFEKTITTVATGFGDIMAEVGLLIGFGVLLGGLLHAMGALQKVVEKLLRALGPRRLPYALAVALSSVFPSIYVDVQLVLAAPLARSAAPHLGRNGLAMMAGSLTAGILVGYVFVVPGLGTISIAGLLDVPLGTMLLYGFVLGPVTALLTVFVYGRMLARGFWNAEKDEVESAPDGRAGAEDAGATDHVSGAAPDPGAAPKPGGETGDAAPAGGATTTAVARERALPPLTVSLLPIVVPLLLIATGAITKAAGVESDVLAFLGDPVFALFAGLVGAYVLARRALGAETLGETMTSGFNSTGQILLVTGVGGSLGAVIGETNLDDVLSGMFSAGAGIPALVTVLLAWLVAAVLHLAIGSIAVAGIAAAGILAPIMGSLGIPAEVLALAIGSGALFALQLNSNFFWMFQTLLGVTTRGALKALTFVTSLASVLSLVLVMILSVVV
ncbi:H+/gluconate symporter-like permease [Prauserella isguenensis]|uniref:H+/gluconate symporter-like permease n=1 Tax=Prauserella isguenensis TaxID=1470180 RepID=A0A839S017_9PSEU|nr:GntP family permease [Prauserella isguenensis]MBB3051411.1 H+/gluconate symporter-like permease [Prauserella isguenensis]